MREKMRIRGNKDQIQGGNKKIKRLKTPSKLGDGEKMLKKKDI